ncbi:hypothetical protein BKA82DRAFT_725994 [Pisolithus tinctorius]|uniref:Uncharacterized protein n=1 Tax=Pisolithus tinctorius Marx 270 TaxID=870435 RepID=A0A0C3J521_PISTI|nr:hypothetical protein BKA82DRAFT_725994 [Pisolithus tinctorius]KIN92781.1 hypothetical protein M404DRAFT_725994 [Pisolithus tinctorius Marx 270]
MSLPGHGSDSTVPCPPDVGSNPVLSATFKTSRSSRLMGGSPDLKSAINLHFSYLLVNSLSAIVVLCPLTSEYIKSTLCSHRYPRFL